MDPNYNATAQTVSDKLDGLRVDGSGVAESFDNVARFYDSRLFGRGKDYAFPVNSNTTPSKLDDITCLSKLWTRTRLMADGNDYDAHDALFTVLKFVLKQDLHINDDEVNSVNYKPAA